MHKAAGKSSGDGSFCFQKQKEPSPLLPRCLLAPMAI